MKKKLELVFLPIPLVGHFSSMIELANLLLNRDQRLSITVIFPKLNNFDIKTIPSPSATQRIRFISLPQQPHDQENFNSLAFKPFLDDQKPRIREAVNNLIPAADGGHDSPVLAGFVVDFLSLTMMDLANELGVPTYVFFTSNAGFLAFLLHLQQLYDLRNQDMDELLGSATEIAVPGFMNSIPSKMIPTPMLIKEAAEWANDNTRRFREASGILVNTFSELESNVMNWFSNCSATSQLPPVYSVGPILNLKESNQDADILKWLDEQPPSSVVFLCFGSLSSFNGDQIKEIALALERAGVRFLWSLRQPPPDYANIEDVLPEGFLNRTAGMGRVIGWAPQAEILSHPATGGFVSHGGWNSILESLWYGVPMAIWSLYAEQPFNGFMMVVELRTAVAISLDYTMKDCMEKGLIMSAEKIEGGIRKLMEDNEEMKKMIKVKSEESKKALMEDGSSFTALNCFIDAVEANCP